MSESPVALGESSLFLILYASAAKRLSIISHMREILALLGKTPRSKMARA